MDKKQYEIYQENKAHTPSDFPYNTYLCSIPLDFKSVKLHWHNETEFIVIKKGEGIVSVDLTAYNVKSGDIIIVLPGQLHSIEQKENKIMEYENILFKPQLLKSSGYDICNDSFIDSILLGNSNIVSFINEQNSIHNQIIKTITEIDALCETRPYGFQLAVKGMLFEIVFLLISQEASDNKKRTNKKSLEKIKSIINYLENHYHENITIEQMAKECFYSKSYFMKFFKETMGISFISYLNDYRLEIAAKKLISSSENILDIAISCGFDNLSYFNRSFKKKFGISPGKYRK